MHTVEHLLATLHALDINNVLIEINSPELPAMDGSSYELLKNSWKLVQKFKINQKKC